MTERRQTAIMISGRGSNMAALIEAASDPSFPAEIAGVVSDQPDAPGLKFAAARGIPTRAVARSDFASREAHDAAIGEALADFGAELVCLAGYMRLLSRGFVEQWAGRMINIHPSLLPLFKGLDSQQRALDAGMRIHGCSVHFVTHEMDDGPIIAQAAVRVMTGDDADTLAARVLKAEHKLYPAALRLLAEGKVRMQNGRAVFSEIIETEPREALFAPDAERIVADLERLARSTP